MDPINREETIIETKVTIKIKPADSSIKKTQMHTKSKAVTIRNQKILSKTKAAFKVVVRAIRIKLVATRAKAVVVTRAKAVVVTNRDASIHLTGEITTKTEVAIIKTGETTTRTRVATIKIGETTTKAIKVVHISKRAMLTKAKKVTSNNSSRHMTISTPLFLLRLKLTLTLRFILSPRQPPNIRSQLKVI